MASIYSFKTLLRDSLIVLSIIPYRRIARYSLIFLFPIIIFAALEGLTQGFLWATWSNDNTERTQNLLREIDRTEWIDVWAGSSMPELRYAGRPFNTTQLKSSDWVSRLGFMLPQETLGSGVPIERIASLEGLMRDIKCHDQYPKHQWTFVSKAGQRQDDPWDAAFASLLKYHEDQLVEQPANLTFVSCKDTPFMCDVWAVKPPCLIHFDINDFEAGSEPGFKQYLEDQGWSYSAPIDHLRPVKVQIIDLPKNIVEAYVPPLVFPSEFELLLSLTTKNWSHDRFDEYHPLKQMHDRFMDRQKASESEEGTIRRWVGKADDWMTDNVAAPLRMDFVSQFVADIGFLASLITVNIVLALVRLGMSTLGEVLGWQSALVPFKFDLSDSKNRDAMITDGLVRKYLRQHHDEFTGLREGAAEELKDDDGLDYDFLRR